MRKISENFLTKDSLREIERKHLRISKCRELMVKQNVILVHKKVHIYTKRVEHYLTIQNVFIHHTYKAFTFKNLYVILINRTITL